MLTELALVLPAETVTITTADRIARPATPTPQIETIAVRISSPQGVLWQGMCPGGGGEPGRELFARSVAGFARSVPAGISVRPVRTKLDQLQPLCAELWQRDPELSLDTNWARPVVSADCGESGARTVQVGQAVDYQAWPDDHDRGRGRYGWN